MAHENLFIFTASNLEAYQHYIDTIERGFSIDTIKDHLTKDQVTALSNIFLNGDMRAWGATPGPVNKKTWEKMKVGEPILIYRKGHLEYYATIVFKIHSPDIAKILWGTNFKGETWEYVYFLDGLTELSVPLKIYNETLEFDQNYKPQGFSRISKIDTIKQKFGSIEDLLHYFVSGKWVEKEAKYTPEVKKEIINERLIRQIGNRPILEANLENLIVNRMDDVEPGLRLIDRQLDTKEVGRLDLLCEDKNKDLVVIELKRAAAGPSIIDQTQRYMGWLIAHKAKPGQKVRGIIVVGTKDTALEYAVKANPTMAVETFSLSFK